jgi:hypothetical protein
MKSVPMPAILYLVVAVLFVASAGGKTISHDVTIINMQWFCAIVFALLGVWRLSKFVRSKTP